MEYFNCHEKGRCSQCQCQEERTSEGTPVERILLNTGCSKTLVRKELIQKKKVLEGEAVTIQCAHGDTVLYPVAKVQMSVDGKVVDVKAADSTWEGCTTVL